MKTLALALAACSAFGASAVETRPYSGDLASEIRSATPAWFGYVFEGTPGDHGNCCQDHGQRCGCRLEGGSSEVTGEARPAGPVRLEDDAAMEVLFRVESNRVQKIRVFSRDCSLDSGGLPLIWIANVPAAASLAYLRTFVHAGSPGEALDGAVLAISQHADAQADAILEDLARPAQPATIREKAIFWMGAARGARGLPALKRILTTDADDDIRDKAIFALSVEGQPEAIDLLIHAARDDPSAHVRGQALFWLAQKAGQRAASAIVDAIENDPDTEVKKRAVFALSQLPKDEGVPKLIEIARSQRNPEVRKQAFFWLGQSGDPRALAFIEHTITR